MYDGDMSSELAITSKHGIVHVRRDEKMCRKMNLADTVVPITTLQALVYALPPCSEPECWKSLDEYHREIGRRYHGR